MGDKFKIGDIVKVIDLNANGIIVAINEKGLFKVKFDGFYIPAFYKETELNFITRPKEEQKV